MQDPHDAGVFSSINLFVCLRRVPGQIPHVTATMKLCHVLPV